MHHSKITMRTIAVAFAAIFLFSFLTVEIYQSSGYPWLRYPGFLESNAEIAVAESHCDMAVAGGMTQLYSLPYKAPFLTQTTLFLHIYRGPPSSMV